MNFPQDLFLDGAYRAASDGRRITLVNPATEEAFVDVAAATVSDVESAVSSAHRAWESGWRDLAPGKRAEILYRVARVLREHNEELAQLALWEVGKPISEARDEAGLAGRVFEYYAGAISQFGGQTLPVGRGGFDFTLKQSMGVVAAIVPWNFPLPIAAWKAAPALAAGNAVVLKPASISPLTALKMGELAIEAGLPPGVLQILPGSGSAVGDALVTHPLVRKVSFTGSTEVGRVLLAQCAATIKKTSMELGGNAPFIVFDDADLDQAVLGAMASKYRNTGQTCVCANRILVQEGVYDAFAQKLKAKVDTLKVGNGLGSDITQGPLIDKAGLEKVEEHVADAVAKGAKVLAGGKRHALGGTFYEPTILTDVTTDMKVTIEETFGPVAPLFKFKTEEEAIRLANATEFGLAAYFYSRDVGRCFRVGEAIESGMVGINAGIISNEIAPFGGVKQSGLGREGSKYGLDEFMEVKYMLFGGI